MHSDAPMFVDGGDPFHLSDGCGDIDGMPASCEEISTRLKDGTASYNTFTAVYITREDGTRSSYAGYTSFEPGLNISFTGSDARIATAYFDTWMPNFGFAAPTAVGAIMGPRLAASLSGREGAGDPFRGFSSSFAPRQSEEEQAAETVAKGVEAGLQVLDKGCWDPSTWNRNVKPHDRYFATVANPDKYTQGWSGSLSVHAKGVIESPSIAGVFEDPMGLWNFNFVIKSYPGQGMAVTADSLSLPHLAAVPGYVTGVDENVNVRWAEWLLKTVPKCKKK